MHASKSLIGVLLTDTAREVTNRIPSKKTATQNPKPALKEATSLLGKVWALVLQEALRQVVNVHVVRCKQAQHTQHTQHTEHMSRLCTRKKDSLKVALHGPSNTPVIRASELTLSKVPQPSLQSAWQHTRTQQPLSHARRYRTQHACMYAYMSHRDHCTRPLWIVCSFASCTEQRTLYHYPIPPGCAHKSGDRCYVLHTRPERLGYVK